MPSNIATAMSITIFGKSNQSTTELNSLEVILVYGSIQPTIWVRLGSWTWTQEVQSSFWQLQPLIHSHQVYKFRPQKSTVQLPFIYKAITWTFRYTWNPLTFMLQEVFLKRQFLLKWYNTHNMIAVVLASAKICSLYPRRIHIFAEHLNARLLILQCLFLVDEVWLNIITYTLTSITQKHLRNANIHHA